jgi:hypothetical protein
MKPRPPYRRVSFWLGLFVAWFLAWAWWDSYQNLSALNLRGGGILHITRAEGATYFNTGGAEGPRFYRDSLGVTLKGRNLEAEWHRWGFRFVKVPDALMFFSFVGLWAGWLVWRGRVESRA